ncbi:flavin reductase family protein [Nocardia gipuzkoensis]|uniref:flavin reductase family protein n=1 Tax=Nocardia gipuzkoensis TaxID=2749991 RepID=UPI001E5DCC82|nr:flavin reductase family protein [Nocardia gipuzkoensis]UGT67758.1 flavin reductase family protein [Nocardia gipuzkoensis]
MTAIDEDLFKAGMRRLAAGVSIISAQSSVGPVGITATAVTSLSAAPPSLLCCVNKNLMLGEAIQHSGRFCLNMLRDEQHPLARRFAGMEGARGTEKFSEGSWIESIGGTPALRDSLVSFDCRLDGVTEHGTHYIVIGLIDEVRLGPPGSPLLYCDATFSSLVPLPAVDV